jgi:hypothetical protein
MNGNMESTTEALEHIRFQLSLLRLTASLETSMVSLDAKEPEAAELVKAVTELEREAARQQAS